MISPEDRQHPKVRNVAGPALCKPLSADDEVENRPSEKIQASSLWGLGEAAFEDKKGACLLPGRLSVIDKALEHPTPSRE